MPLKRIMLLPLALAACNGGQPTAPDRGANIQAPAPAATFRRATAANAPPQEGQRQCRFEVDDKRLLNGPCQVYPMGDGGYTLNTWSKGKPARSHFAVVTVRRDGRADATWNADPDDNKAMDPLGIVTLQDGCWRNDRARICAR